MDFVTIQKASGLRRADEASDTDDSLPELRVDRNFNEGPALASKLAESNRDHRIIVLHPAMKGGG